MTRNSSSSPGGGGIDPPTGESAQKETREAVVVDAILTFRAGQRVKAHASGDWSELEKVGFWQWDPKSENKPSQRCGGLTIDGMKTIDCDTKQQSLCQFKGSKDYDKIGDFGYYQLFKELDKNWTDAIGECLIRNSNLLVLRSTDEYDAVFKYYSDSGFITGSIDLFYGVHQIFADKWFLTVFDELVEETGYDVWAPGEPGDGAGVDFPYVGLRLTDSTTPDADAGMFLLPMGTPMAYICKRDLH